MIEVVAAAIIIDDKVLITQRPEGKQLALMWEFPGGKIELGETHQECIIREIKEELDVDIEVNGYIASNSHKYNFDEIQIHLYQATVTNGEIKLLEHQNLAWVDKNTIDKYEYPAVDIMFIEKLKEIL